MKIARSISIAAVLTLMIVIVAQAAGSNRGNVSTTTPDGSIVNENVRYNQKIEVYLDEGSGPNAPANRSGARPMAGMCSRSLTLRARTCSQMDPSKCRVFEVNDGIITPPGGAT